MLKKFVQKYSRRPFPRNFASLRSCRISYSQFGEDLFLSTLLGYEKAEGIYVDVGCYHPINYSNTYIFYERGWHGLAIDPNPGWQRLWEQYRPRDRFLNTAVTPSKGTMNYLMNSRYPACNRLVAATPAQLSPDEKVVTVPTVPLDVILREHLPNTTKIDLLNVDCEGFDLAVIQTLDFSRVKPRVIAAEDSEVGLESPLCRFLQPHGYECRAHIGLTKVFEFSSQNS
jgi:FkbM family methyltransferase